MSVKEIKPGVIEIRCDDCGEFIDHTSRKYGMDCKNKCAEKGYKKLPLWQRIIGRLLIGE